ncbi:ribitol-5-phosphate xylosyltransferase 1-like [Watersipora subatra]|uniref:ribitol-5-phosphate xylosyltransferase 1-like n=1 Tax=Watersipora subatra TaxID=2589382 RepID=UPI00355C9E1F
MKLRFFEWLMLTYTFAVLLTCLLFFRSLKSSNASSGSLKTFEQRNRAFNVFRFDASSNLAVGQADQSQPVETDLISESKNEKRYWNQWAPVNLLKQNLSYIEPNKLRLFSHADYLVDIWSNNGLGDYLWQHIIQAELKSRPDKLYRHGEKTIHGIKYRFKGGDNLSLGFVSDTTENVIFVLNGRSNKTRETTRAWLDGLADLDALQNVGLVLIGDELCDNSWLLGYLQNKTAYSPKFVFLVYDSPLIDDKTVFQFPLGVATYRGFPLPAYPDLVVKGVRKYVCNFIGTVYSNSSRELLVKHLERINVAGTSHCYLKVRYTWQPTETQESLSSYVEVLKSSDLTLCPLGLNAESYRIYEALSVGSVPIIEDAVMGSNCSSTPYRLLRRHKAPVVFVKDWSELPKVLANEKKLSIAAKERRREKMLNWYQKFRSTLAVSFTSTVLQKFFNATV